MVKVPEWQAAAWKNAKRRQGIATWSCAAGPLALIIMFAYGPRGEFARLGKDDRRRQLWMLKIVGIERHRAASSEIEREVNSLAPGKAIDVGNSGCSKSSASSGIERHRARNGWGTDR